MNNLVDLWFWSVASSILLCTVPLPNRKRKPAIEAGAVGLAALAVLFVAPLAIRLAGSIALIVSIWQLLSTLRYLKNRHHPVELYRRVRTSSYWLFLLVLVTILILATTTGDISQDVAGRWLVGMLATGMSIAALLLTTTIVNLWTRRVHDAPAPNSSAPTVTLAIPARNETLILNQALEQALGSDYPKLETLVLDDCSHDDTPEIIRDFAHRGVRFVQGAEPAAGWLGKNRAYRLLLEEASGDIVIFIGVDVRFDRTSISRLIAYMTHNQLDMISVMPRRRGFDFWANLLQPLRYALQVALPRSLFGNEPVLSTCWAVRREALKQLHGFKPTKGAVVPEQYFANNFAAQHRYAFILASAWLGITTHKPLRSQLATVTRTLYPSMRQELAFVLPATVAAIALFVVPYVIVILNISGLYQLEPAVGISWSVVGILSSINALIAVRTNPKAAALAAVNVPVVVSLHVLMAVWSMLKYEFGAVHWKGRNVCLPVLNSKTPVRPSRLRR